TPINNGLAPGTTAIYVLDLAIDPQTPTTLYAGTYEGGFKSTNGGGSWTRIFTSSLADTITRPMPYITSIVLAIDPVTPSTLYAGVNPFGLFKSLNGGGNWFGVNDGLLAEGSSYYYPIRALAIDPATPTTIYAGTAGGGVFKTTNGAGNWTPLHTPFTSVEELAITPGMPTILYAGTSGSGVFKSTNGGADWHALNNGLTSSFVHTLAIDPLQPTILYAGTAGGGVFVNQQVIHFFYLPLFSLP
ncbi:MAG: hypothetical protein MUF69_12140, partial [Desulfobacterota bacterium]|nr:hypothetical protein [Thermodesulfobacteriota bacterium]